MLPALKSLSQMTVYLILRLKCLQSTFIAQNNKENLGKLWMDDFSLLIFHWLQSRQRNPMCKTVPLGLGKMIPIPEIFSVIYHYKEASGR